jgi:integrase
VLKLKFDCEAASLKDVAELYEHLNYGTAVSVGVKICAETGCRINELQHMLIRNVINNEIIWKLGKNQGNKPARHEKVSNDLLDEIFEYRKSNNVPSERLLSCEGHTISSYFNKFIRPLLGPSWHETRVLPHNQGFLSMSYVLQLKSLRKTFSTINTIKEYQKWKDWGVAMRQTANRMRHKNYDVTLKHYLRDFEKFKDIDTSKEVYELIRAHGQKRIIQYI